MLDWLLTSPHWTEPDKNEVALHHHSSVLLLIFFIAMNTEPALSFLFFFLTLILLKFPHKVKNVDPNSENNKSSI